MNARLVERCGLCGGDRLELVLSLGTSPPTCAMQCFGARQVSENHYPLELLRCHDCTLVQLSVIVAPEMVFDENYPYSSGNSKALHANFEDLARQTDDFLRPDDLVVDIGANDGTLLSKFKCRTVGVEPTRQAEKIQGPAVRAFFGENVAKRILAEYGQAKVITACNVLAHVENIGDVMRGINHLLADDGVLIAENHDLASIVDGGQWDTVYHEHLRYFSPASFAALLNRHGLVASAIASVPTHGGSFRMLGMRLPITDVSRGSPRPDREYDFPLLAVNALVSRDMLRSSVLGGGGYGIGATARATTIVNYCGLDVEDISCVCEVAGSDKIGRLIPGTRIPVVDEERLYVDRPEWVVLFSWHLADRIVPKLRERGYIGEIILPLPTLQTA